MWVTTDAPLEQRAAPNAVPHAGSRPGQKIRLDKPSRIVYYCGMMAYTRPPSIFLQPGHCVSPGRPRNVRRQWRQRQSTSWMSARRSPRASSSTARGASPIARTGQSSTQVPQATQAAGWWVSVHPRFRRFRGQAAGRAERRADAAARACVRPHGGPSTVLRASPRPGSRPGRAAAASGCAAGAAGRADGVVELRFGEQLAGRLGRLGAPEARAAPAGSGSAWPLPAPPSVVRRIVVIRPQCGQRRPRQRHRLPGQFPANLADAGLAVAGGELHPAMAEGHRRAGGPPTGSPGRAAAGRRRRPSRSARPPRREPPRRRCP